VKQETLMSASTETAAGQQQAPRKGPKKTRAKRRTAAQIAAANGTAARPANGATVTTIKPTASRAAQMTARALNIGSPPALMADLIQTLPAIGNNFPQSQQTAFLAAATSILGVLYPAAPKAN
jgi:hypothetical protein